MGDVVCDVMDSEVLVQEEVEGGGFKGEDESEAEAAVLAETSSEVSVKEGVEGGGSNGKEESKDEADVDDVIDSEVSVKGEEGVSKGKEASSEDSEKDGESSEASSSSEEEEEEDEEESSEASSSSSDEEQQMAKKHGGGGDIAALIKEGELIIGINDDEDEEEEEEASMHRIDSKHEVEVLPPVPKIEIQLEPHHKALPVGTISSIMGERVIVEGSVQHNPLNEGSILWITESRTPLGIVEEIFGPVKNPYYLVRYNSVEEVPAGISAGTAVSFVIEFADHILNVKELYTKGYDESGDNVEDQTDPEFSDDEKEAEYKRSLRMGKRQTDKQLESKKHSGNKKRKQRRDAGFHKDMTPRIQDSERPGHQPKHRLHRSDMASAADNSARSLGPQSTRTSLPIMTPSVSVNPAMEAAHFADQKGGCFPNPSQQFLPQQPNVVRPGGFPSPMYPNMGINGAALAANIMQNILSGASQYQQHYHNQGFGGFANGMPIAPTQFANPMPFGGPPVNSPFGPTSESGMGQGNSYNLGHLASNQAQMPPGLPNAQGYGSLPPSHGDGSQYPMQFNSGQFNQGNSSFCGRPPHQGGRHSQGRGGGGHHK